MLRSLSTIKMGKSRQQRDGGARSASTSNLFHQFVDCNSRTLREDNQLVQRKGIRKCFFKGGTSSCRVHIRTHYPEYVKRCKAAGVTEHPWAIPPKILKEREAEAQKDMKGDMGTLKAKGFAVVPAQGPEQFSKKSVLEYTSKFIVCTDQVSWLYTPATYKHSQYLLSLLLLLTMPSIETAWLQCVHSPKVVS